MKITVKTIKHNYNVSEKSPIKGALKLLGKFVLFLVVLYIFLIILSNYLVHFISLETEIKYFNSFEIGNKNLELTKKINDKFKNIKYDLSVINEPSQINAFAGLGGKIYLTSALIDEVKTDNELLFFIGHEIAHIENRDVFKLMISETPIQILLILVGLDSMDTMYLFDSITFVYGKNIENKADLLGVDFVNNYNNHVGCVTDFFERNNEFISNLGEIASDHPTTQSRIDKIKNYIEEKGYIKETCTKFNY